MEKKKSIFLVILLCILVVVAAGGSSYLVFASIHDQETQALNDQADTLQAQIDKLQKETKTTTNTTTPTTQKTYTNTQMKYSIKYPSTWNYSVQSDTPNNVTFKKIGNDQNDWNVTIDKEDNSSIQLQIGNQTLQPGGFTFEQFVANNLPMQGEQSVTAVKNIPTDSGIIYEVSYSGIDLGGKTFTAHSAYFNLTHNQYLAFNLSDEADLQAFESMLPTFLLTQ